MNPFSSPDRAPRPVNPLKDLTHLAIQTQDAAQELPEGEPLLPEENVEFVVNGSASLLKTLHELARVAVLDEDNPLFDREVRHDIRNQVAVVKGFADLMAMEMPDGHELKPRLDRIANLCTEFVDRLDEARSHSTGTQGSGGGRLAVA